MAMVQPPGRRRAALHGEGLFIAGENTGLETETKDFRRPACLAKNLVGF